LRLIAVSHSYTNLLYHIVFSTKQREPWLDATIRPRVWEYLGGAIRGEGGVPLIVNGVADHVHILAKLRQDIAVSDVLRAIKANSSGWIHETFPHLAGFAWQVGYGAFSVSHSRSRVPVHRRSGSTPSERLVSGRIRRVAAGA
jgi:REP element-mobilizing transposase RayT